MYIMYTFSFLSSITSISFSSSLSFTHTHTHFLADQHQPTNLSSAAYFQFPSISRCLELVIKQLTVCGQKHHHLRSQLQLMLHVSDRCNLCNNMFHVSDHILTHLQYLTYLFALLIQILAIGP